MWGEKPFQHENWFTTIYLIKKNDTEGNCWQTRPPRLHPPCLTHHLFSQLCHLEWKMKVSQWRNKLGQFFKF